MDITTHELGLFDDTPPLVHQDARRTEVAAAATVAPAMGRLVRLAYEAVDAAGARGITADELCAMYPDENPYSLRPRLTQLGPGKPRRPGLRMIFPRGERANRRGNAEVVWFHRRYLTL